MSSLCALNMTMAFNIYFTVKENDGSRSMRQLSHLVATIKKQGPMNIRV